jgi:hypothetical protein
MSNVIPLARKPAPAYTPTGGPPGWCSTPGHKKRPGRLFAGGWKCWECGPVPSGGRGSSDKEARSA